MNCLNVFALSTESARVNILGRQAYNLQTFNFNLITHGVFKKKTEYKTCSHVFDWLCFSSAHMSYLKMKQRGVCQFCIYLIMSWRQWLKLTKPHVEKKISAHLIQDAVVEGKFLRINLWFTIKSQRFLHFNLKTWLIVSLPLMVVPEKEKDMRTGDVRCGFLTFLFQHSLIQPIQRVQFAKRFANFSTFLNQNDTKSKGALCRVQRRI